MRLLGITEEGGQIIGVPQGYKLMNAIKTTERKLYELQQVNILIATLHGPDRAGNHGITAESQKSQNGCR